MPVLIRPFGNATFGSKAESRLLWVHFGRCPNDSSFVAVDEKSATPAIVTSVWPVIQELAAFKSAKPDSVGGGSTTLVVASGFKEWRQHESSYPRRSIAAVVCTSHISAKPASIFAGACLISRRLACSECAHSAKTPNGRDSRTNAV